MNGNLDMKDSIGPLTTGTGVTMITLSPAVILQAVGLIIAIVGAYYTHRRFHESKRANDIAEDRLSWEKEKHAKTTNVQSCIETERSSKAQGEAD